MPETKVPECKNCQNAVDLNKFHPSSRLICLLFGKKSCVFVRTIDGECGPEGLFFSAVQHGKV